MISAGKATLRECQEVYSVADVYTMLEVISVDAHNRNAHQKHFEQKARDKGLIP